MTDLTKKIEAVQMVAEMIENLESQIEKAVWVKQRVSGFLVLCDDKGYVITDNFNNSPFRPCADLRDVVKLRQGRENAEQVLADLKAANPDNSAVAKLQVMKIKDAAALFIAKSREAIQTWQDMVADAQAEIAEAAKVADDRFEGPLN